MTGGICRRSFEVEEVKQIKEKEKEIEAINAEVTELSRKLEETKRKDLRATLKTQVNVKSEILIKVKMSQPSTNCEVWLTTLCQLHSEIQDLKDLIDFKAARHLRKPRLKH
eukprot:768792-Hanusia_phi.AAC.1